MQTNDDFEFSSLPEEQDFLLPPLADSYRVHEVRVVLPGDPMGKILLSCRQKKNEDRVVRGEYEYDMASQYWTEGGELYIGGYRVKIKRTSQVGTSAKAHS